MTPWASGRGEKIELDRVRPNFAEGTVPARVVAVASALNTGTSIDRKSTPVEKPALRLLARVYLGSGEPRLIDGRAHQFFWFDLEGVGRVDGEVS